MKSTYKRTCYYVVDRWICEGYIDKYGFHLTESNWDEDTYKKPWKVKKKDIFYDKDKALNELEKRYGYHAVSQYYKDVLEDYI